jgi:hypothetical protein
MFLFISIILILLDLPKKVATIVYWLRDKETFKESLYGVASDRVSHIRSDDDGFTWKSVALREFTTVSYFLFCLIL